MHEFIRYVEGMDLGTRLAQQIRWMTFRLELACRAYRRYRSSSAACSSVNRTLCAETDPSVILASLRRDFGSAENQGEATAKRGGKPGTASISPSSLPRLIVIIVEDHRHK